MCWAANMFLIQASVWQEAEPNDAWSRYLSEVRKYREQSCEEEGKRRPLVKWNFHHTWGYHQMDLWDFDQLFLPNTIPWISLGV
jgi:hypothetical protein